MAKRKNFYIPFPAQWTVLFAHKLHWLSKRYKLPYQWSAAEAGGIAMLWQRESALLSVKNTNCTFTLLALNSGEILFFSERNGFGNTDGYYLHENDLDELAEELISTVRKHL